MKKNYLKYFLLCTFLLIISETTKYFLLIDKLVYNSLAENLTSSQINNIISLQKKWQWIGYLFVPIYVLLKTSIVASVLYIGTFFFNKNEITFKNIWSIVINAEFIFLLMPIFKIVWFYFFQTNYTLEDIQYYFPLSAINITGYKGIEAWLIYPLQTLNLFEVAYIIYLSHQIGSLTKTNADDGLKIVSYSYLLALLLWVTVVMFFTLNYS